jgi:hypothetical protein
MNLAKRSLMFVGFVVSVAALVSVLAPTATHGVAVALEQISNTSANPVPIYDSGLRFQADLCNSTGPNSQNFCGANNSSTFVVPTVTSSGATVKQLIVDNVSGYCSSYANQKRVIKAIDLVGGQFVPDAVPNGATSASHYVPIVGPAHSFEAFVGGPSLFLAETDYTYGQTTHFSFNPGDTVTLVYYSFGPKGTDDAACLARIEGMLATE